MAKKKDPSITYLNKFGYNVVKLPRVGIEPMDVVGKDETTQWLGPLRKAWQSAAPEPQLSGPNPATHIEGQQTDKLDLQFGIHILANALSAFGASMPSLDFAYQRARSIAFSFSNVTSTSVAPFDAGNYLAKGTLKTDNPVVEHYFRSPEAEAYLLVDVLKSDTITVTATDEHGFGVDLDIPAIQNVLGAKVGVKPSATSKGTVSYTGPQEVSFAFVANAIEFDGTKWSMHGITPDGDHAFGLQGDSTSAGAALAVAEPEAVILSSSCLLRLSEA